METYSISANDLFTLASGAAFEASRSKADRIAYCGKVSVNTGDPAATQAAQAADKPAKPE